MPEFYLVAAAFLIVAAYFVLFPIMIDRGAGVQNRRAINVELFRERLQELQREMNAGVISDDEFHRLETELQRRLLEDTGGDQAGTDVEPATGTPSATSSVSTGKSSSYLIVIALCAIPLLAFLVYQQVGAKADWDIVDTLKKIRQVDAAGSNNDENIAGLVTQLNERLEQRPDSGEYLMTLASLHMEAEEYPAAVEAYKRLSNLYPRDASVLGRYAQALYLSSGRKLTATISGIADRALSINPSQPAVLGMLGIAHFEAKNFRASVDYWSRLLVVLDPNTPNYQMISRGIEQAKNLSAESGAEIASAETTSLSSSADNNVVLTVDVSLAESQSADPDTEVFVFARAVSGPPMPLAVARLRVADLPTTVRLDDSMAMMPQMRLSNFKQVELVARISRGGSAIAASGDIEGSIGPIEVVTGTPLLRIVIDRVLP